MPLACTVSEILARVYELRAYVTANNVEQLFAVKYNSIEKYSSSFWQALSMMYTVFNLCILAGHEKVFNTWIIFKSHPKLSPTTAYDFLLVSHSSYVRILYHFRDIVTHGWKARILKHIKSLILLKKLVFISNFNVFVLMFVICFFYFSLIALILYS